MIGPSPILMEAYGTDAYYLEKCGEIPPSARLLLPAAFMVAEHYDSRHQQELLANAAALNEQFRAEEHERMRGTEEGFKGAAFSSAVRAGVLFAKAAAVETPKQLHTMSRAAPTIRGAVVPRVASNTFTAGLKMASTKASSKTSTKEAGFGDFAAFGKSMVNAAKGLVSSAAPALEKGVAGLKNWGGTALKAEAGATRGLAAASGGNATQQATQVLKAGKPASAMATTPYRTAAAPMAATSAVSKTPAIQSAPAVASAAPQAGKPLLSGISKAQLLGAGAVAGAGYLGAKGLQATRDYMMIPTAQERWGHGQSPVASPNQYGYTTY